MASKASLSISLGYLLFGSAWVLVSDHLAAALAPDRQWLFHIQTLKGWAFIWVTSFLLFLLARRVISALLAARAACVRSEDAAERSERRFRQLFDQLPLPVQGFGPDMQVRYWNQASTQLYGYPQQVAIGASILDLIVKTEDRSAFSETVRKLHRYQLGGFSGEFTARSQDGTDVPVFSKMLLVREGQAEDIFCLDWDLTEIRRAREWVKESEARYRTIFQQSRTAIVIADAQGICVDCNARTLELFRCSREQILGQSAIRFSPPRQRDGRESAAAFRELFNESKICTQVFEWCYQRAGDDLIDSETTVAWVTVSGQPHVITFIRDITAERSAAQALKRSEERFRAIFENAAVGIVVVDISGRYVHFNDKWLEMLGYAPEEMRALEVSHLTHPDDLPRTRDELERLFRGERLSYRMEKRYIRKSGESFWAALSVASIHEEGLDGPLALGVVVDINDARTLRERELDLERRLIQGQKAEALGTLAGGIAHDFNNILFGIMGYAEMALTALDTRHPAQGYLESVRTAALRSRELVQQILAFSRQAEVSPQPVQPRAVIQEALTLIRASLPSTILIQTWHPSEAFVNADPAQLHQMIMNLCTNAGHAMEETGGSLTVELRDLDVDARHAGACPGIAPGRYVQLSVSDTGKGIPASILEKIFDPYFTTKPKGKGTGMGLAVVQGIVRQMGGAVSVESKEGVGTTFRLLLPAIECRTPQAASEDKRLIRGAGRVLFVDDEEILTHLGEHLLGHLGYNVTAFTDSREALSALQASPDGFDLVITDYTMPGMTGIQLAERIKAIRPGLPVILATGNSENLTKARARQLGIRRIIRKPVTIQELSHHVGQVLQGPSELPPKTVGAQG